ncbi:hypothetical protein E2C01_066965 [Portunus trituberculatus]|uniref:Uncharacterized protein n=1 Tax=Portunus trituberculatus TaxID=210409 RepID=A0A5B7HRF3_PORTR|nr:hypothetical protein [Portunus trituberculatus]
MVVRAYLVFRNHLCGSLSPATISPGSPPPPVCVTSAPRKSWGSRGGSSWDLKDTPTRPGG